MAVLCLSKIRKRFGSTLALDSVSLRLEKGEVHALVGENGAGKSTLMNVIAGSLRADEGQMELDGKPYTPIGTHDALLRGISLIHQEFSLCPHLSVAENIMMGIEPARLGWLDRKRLRECTLEALKSFHHAEIEPNERVANLSIAARQIVEICRAIAFRAQIILMDEPTSSLQRGEVDRLFAIIRKLKCEGTSIIYISHFLEEVREIADRFTVLRDGRTVSTGEISSVSDNNLIAEMVGRPIGNIFPKRALDSSKIRETILEVRGLAALPLLQHADFELRRGEIVGIAGLLGSGRSTLIRAILGLQKVDKGTIVLRGDASRRKPARPLIQQVGYLSEDRKREGLVPSLSIADNVTLTRFSSCSRLGWVNLTRQNHQANKVIQALRIKACSSAESVVKLSGGNQQKVVVARLVHQDAEVILLDEPTRGIDIASKVQVYETISRWATKSNKAVLMVSSHLPELFGMCDRLAVMSHGRLSQTKPISSWTPTSVLQAAIGSHQTDGGD